MHIYIYISHRHTSSNNYSHTCIHIITWCITLYYAKYKCCIHIDPTLGPIMRTTWGPGQHLRPGQLRRKIH